MSGGGGGGGVGGTNFQLLMLSPNLLKKSFRAKIITVLFWILNTEWFAIRSIANHKKKKNLINSSFPNVNLFSVVQYEYIKHEDSNCLFGNDLDSLRTDGTPDHDNCKEWCNNNANCQAFAVSEQNSCFFKSYECGNDIQRGRAVLYTKIGNWSFPAKS